MKTVDGRCRVHSENVNWVSSSFMFRVKIYRNSTKWTQIVALKLAGNPSGEPGSSRSSCPPDCGENTLDKFITYINSDRRLFMANDIMPFRMPSNMPFSMSFEFHL